MLIGVMIVTGHIIMDNSDSKIKQIKNFYSRVDSDSYTKELEERYGNLIESDVKIIKQGNLNFDSTGRAYPDNPELEENWDCVWEFEGKYYTLVGDDGHKEWEEVNINKNQNKMKTLNNTTANQAKDNVKDIVFWGNGDTFKLISKASSVNEGWMKSTKAMEIPGVGCVVQVTTQQGTNIAEALTFVPNVKIKETKDTDIDVVIGRKLVSI